MRVALGLFWVVLACLALSIPVILMVDEVTSWSVDATTTGVVTDTLHGKYCVSHLGYTVDGTRYHVEADKCWNVGEHRPVHYDSSDPENSTAVTGSGALVKFILGCLLLLAYTVDGARRWLRRRRDRRAAAPTSPDCPGSSTTHGAPS